MITDRNNRWEPSRQERQNALLLQTYQKNFIDLAIEFEALSFGNFTLKSGRQSPYFFNAGKFCRSDAVARLGACYASAIVEIGLRYDVLFGPAYKGIPLVVSAAIALFNDYGINVPFSFDRKETKTHGEGGCVIGARLAGRVLIIDDVITAGTAVRQVVSMITESGAEVGGVLVGLDRGERGAGRISAAEELQSALGVAVQAIVGIDQLIAYVGESPDLRAHLPAMEEYRRRWGAT